MSIYAKNTSVAVEKSRAEIEMILARYGASAFAYATNEGNAMIQFVANDRRIMFVLQLPNPSDAKFTRWGGKQYGSLFSKERAIENWEQACRQKWRCLALTIKAKLEAVESGISLFEDEFLANIVMPDGKTVGYHVKPTIETAYKTGRVSNLLEFKP